MSKDHHLMIRVDKATHKRLVHAVAIDAVRHGGDLNVSLVLRSLIRDYCSRIEAKEASRK